MGSYSLHTTAESVEHSYPSWILQASLSSIKSMYASQHSGKKPAFKNDVLLVQQPDDPEEILQREDDCVLLTIYPIDLPQRFFTAKQVNQRQDLGIVQLLEIKTVPCIELSTSTNHLLDNDDLTPLLQVKDGMHFKEWMQNKCHIISQVPDKGFSGESGGFLIGLCSVVRKDTIDMPAVPARHIPAYIRAHGIDLTEIPFQIDTTSILALGKPVQTVNTWLDGTDAGLFGQSTYDFGFVLPGSMFLSRNVHIPLTAAHGLAYGMHFQTIAMKNKLAFYTVKLYLCQIHRTSPCLT